MGNSETIWDSEDIRKNRMQTVKGYNSITSLHDILMTGYPEGGQTKTYSKNTGSNITPAVCNNFKKRKFAIKASDSGYCHNSF